MIESMQLVSVILHLRPVADCILPLSHGHLAYAAAHDLFLRLEPRLSHALHQADGRKPFTVSPLQGVKPKPRSRTLELTADNTYTWRLTGLGGEVSALLRDLGKSTSLLRGVRLGQAVFEIEGSADTVLGDYISLQQKWQGVEGTVTSTLHFTSPTTFRVGRFEQPFPLPRWVFGSLLDAWNAHSGYALEVSKDSFEEIGLTNWRGQTRRIEFGGVMGGTVGFEGRFAYRPLNGAPELHRLVGLLSEFAAFAGVGWQTTSGLGQVEASVEVSAGAEPRSRRRRVRKVTLEP